ncbi:hypothetical protein TKK_0001819 [Trichogramma kaykai]|uniref:Pseudouridine-5'-phosphatase n=1 Tax=Trichogramma kaykai TaxID=54128 RepID=A0ABD2XF52_9HYME
MDSKDAPFKPVIQCIFDMDGLLLNTEALYLKVFNDILEPYGKRFTLAHKAETMGFQSAQIVHYLVEKFELPMSDDHMHQVLQQKYSETFPTAQLLPGVERLLRHLKAHRIPIALGTSSSDESYNLKTSHLQEIFDLFDHKVMGSSDPEVKRGKPQPDIFYVAARRFPDNPEPCKCLVFEDSPNGVEAGLNAGMQTVMVPDPELPRNLTGRATLVIDTLENFKPELFGLPKFQ